MPGRPKVLYVSDLAYWARGRRYCDEDIDLTAQLRKSFDIALCHPKDATALMPAFDLVGRPQQRPGGPLPAGVPGGPRAGGGAGASASATR